MSPRRAAVARWNEEFARIRRAYWKLLAVAACWGASWLAGRVVAAANVDPLLAAMLRFLFGCAGLAGVLTMSAGLERPPKQSWIPMTLMGVSGIFLYNLCFFYGLRYVPAGRGALIVSAQPALIYLLMVFAGKERATWIRSGGLLIALSGAAVVLAQGNPARLFSGGVSKGDFVIVGCMLSWIAYTLLGRWAMRFASALTVTVFSTWIGTALLAMSAFSSGAVSGPALQSIPFGGWLSFAFLGFFATALAFVWYLDGVREIGPSSAAVFLNLVPVFGVLLSAVFLSEPLTAFTLGGGVLVMFGVRLLNRRAVE